MSNRLRKLLLAGVAIAALPSTLMAADFELGMVIKSTTNPYYNATLAGAKIAAEEIGGKVENYGPTESSAKAQVDIINSLADRHISAIAVAPSDPDAVVPAMKRAQKLGAKVITFDADASRRTAVLRQPGDQRFDRPVRRGIADPRTWRRSQGRGRDRFGAADRRQPESLDRGLQGRDRRNIPASSSSTRSMATTTSRRPSTPPSR